MTENIVLDTNVLCVAETQDFTRAAKIIGLLGRLLDGGSIAVDLERKILNEYYDNCNGLASNWVSKMSRAGRINFYCHSLNHEVEEQLDQLRFDPNDRKFIGVASRAARVILHEEDNEDWNAEVCTYLAERLGIRVSDCHGLHETA